MWMVLFFLFFETGVRFFWHPHIIGQRLYTRFADSYSYGFDEEQRIWFQKKDQIHFYPTQYLNFHRQRISATKNPNDYRIFTLGGSVSRGMETSNYSYYLQERLNAEKPDRHWAAVNLSADGIGSHRMLLLLKKILPLKPDLIILHVHGSNEYEDERDNAYRKKIHSGLNGVVLQSHLLVLLKKFFVYISNPDSSSVSDSDNELDASQNPSNQQRWLKTIDRNLFKMIELCVQSNVPVILVGRAEKLEGRHGYVSIKANRINDVLKKNAQVEATYFDTANKFLKIYPQNQGKEVLFVDETHWTEYGHQVIAHELQMHLHRLTDLAKKVSGNWVLENPNARPRKMTASSPSERFILE